MIPSSTVQGSRVCHPLAIIGDDVVEMNETFTILLVEDSLQDVVAGPSTASVTILDDDGRLTLTFVCRFSMHVVNCYVLVCTQQLFQLV